MGGTASATRGRRVLRERTRDASEKGGCESGPRGSRAPHVAPPRNYMCLILEFVRVYVDIRRITIQMAQESSGERNGDDKRKTKAHVPTIR